MGVNRSPCWETQKGLAVIALLAGGNMGTILNVSQHAIFFYTSFDDVEINNSHLTCHNSILTEYLRRFFVKITIVLAGNK